MSTTAETQTHNEELVTYQHKFTPDEKLALGGVLMDLFAEQSDIEFRKKAALAGFKQELEAVAGRIDETITKYRDGYEDRDIMAEKTINGTSLKYEWMVATTGEVVQTKEMTPADIRAEFGRRKNFNTGEWEYVDPEQPDVVFWREPLNKKELQILMGEEFVDGIGPLIVPPPRETADAPELNDADGFSGTLVDEKELKKRAEFPKGEEPNENPDDQEKDDTE